MGIADNTPQKGYCIYAHLNKINGKVYIGISKDVKKRWVGKVHAYKHSDLFQNALRKYGWDGFEHIVLWDNLTLEEACQQEKAFIFLYKFIGKSYNMTDGGEGHEGVKLTEEQKQRLREVHTGKSFSDEHKRKLSEAQLKNSIRRKKTYKFDKVTGKLLKEYNSVIEASRDTGVRDSLISSSARGIINTAGGFIWSYCSTINPDRLKINKERLSRRKKLYCYDLQGKLVRTYSCAYEAAEELNASHKRFSYYCTKQKGCAYMGYIWRYEFCKIDPQTINKLKNRKR